jgi:hypothetical protein
MIEDVRKLVFKAIFSMHVPEAQPEFLPFPFSLRFCFSVMAGPAAGRGQTIHALFCNNQSRR